MKFLRNHWFDIGTVIGVLLLLYLFIIKPDIKTFTFFLTLNLISLFFHQFEEYRFPGYFPGMVNSVMYKSTEPDKFPLNTHSALIINITGWVLYSIAILMGFIFYCDFRQSRYSLVLHCGNYNFSCKFHCSYFCV